MEGLSASNALHTVVLTAQIHSFFCFFLVYETLNKKTKQAPGENHNLKITTSPLNYILDHGSFLLCRVFSQEIFMFGFKVCGSVKKRQ